MLRIVHFEIPADDPERAAEFYRTIFGWEIKKWEGPEDYWMVMTGDKNEPGINGGIMRRMGQKIEGAIGAYVCTVQVPSIDEYITKVKDNNGTIEMDKTEVPKVGWMAYCRDTEGNAFSIMEFMPGAMGSS